MGQREVEPDAVTDELARESSELGDRIDQTREDWQRKRADDDVPGAPPPDGPSDDPGPADDA